MSREKNMNNNHVKSIYNFLIALVMTIGIFSFLTVKASASVSLPAVSSRGYLEVVAIKDIAVYRDSSLTTRGTSSPVKSYNAYISRNDVVYIYGISSTYCYISYPTSSGRRLGYCNILDLLFRNCCDLKVTSQGNCTVYKNYSDGIYYGSIAKNDTVYIIGKCNNMLFTVYSARSGNRAYKAGWISIDIFESTINPQRSPSSGTVYYVTTNGASLILRSSPSTSGSKRATMPNGSKVTVYSIQNGWASLNYNGINGYAFSAYLSTSAPNNTNSNVDSAAREYGIPASSNAYKALQSIYNKYSSTISNSKTCVFLFEGVGNSGSSSTRKNAMCVVVKDKKITYINRNSSTIPDYPFNPGKNGNTAMPTIKDGTYNFTTTNHKGSYAALNITNPGVVRFNNINSFYSSTSSAINVHQRSTDSIAPSNKSWVNSAGCQLVGLRSEYLNFIKKIGIVNSTAKDGQRYQNYVTGRIVIDRTYAYNYLRNVGYSSSAIKLIRGY